MSGKRDVAKARPTPPALVVNLAALRRLIPKDWTLDEDRVKAVGSNWGWRVTVLDKHDLTRLWIAGWPKQVNRRMALAALRELVKEGR
jgi:hypothetical protein